jgi:hypothetical protein
MDRGSTHCVYAVLSPHLRSVGDTRLMKAPLLASWAVPSVPQCAPGGCSPQVGEVMCFQ